MKISKNWLSDFLDLDDVSDEQFEDLVTTKVAEVDEVEQVAKPLAAARLARIESIEPHPSKDKLSVLRLALGAEEVSLVSGAPNLQESSYVAFLPPGAYFHDPRSAQLIEIENREIAGVQSSGVIASEAELGLTASHEGVLLFDSSSSKVGQAVSDLLGEPDTVLEIDNKSLTHRPDLWSHLGFARELAAILGRPLKRSPDTWADDDKEGAQLLKELGRGKGEFGVKIEQQSRCRRFTSLEISGIRVGESPLWLRRRLFAVDAGVHNLVVDVSNYVMLDVGQPNHAYDFDTLSGKEIVVRPASKSEKLLCLDDLERELSEEDIVIADGSGAVALAGVIGGMKTSVTEKTERLLLENANFDPVLVRQTTKRHQLRTDASNRFEKDRSPLSVPLGIQRFVELLRELEQPISIEAAVADSFSERPKAVSIPLSFDYVNQRLGAELADEDIAAILSSLSFNLSKQKTGVYQAGVPYYRATRDIQIADDLVEEVGRIYGYERVPETAPQILSLAPKQSKLRASTHSARELLRGLGFSEAYNYSFMSKDAAERLGYSSPDEISLLNPVDVRQDLLRTSLVPGMLEAVSRNQRFFSRQLLFEFGRTYLKNSKPDAKLEASREDDLFFTQNAPAAEQQMLSLAYSSGRKEEEVAGVLEPALAQGADFFALASVLRKLNRLFSSEDLRFLPIENASDAYPWMHPARAALISLSGVKLGVIAEVRADFIEDVSARFVLAELDFEQLTSAALERESFQRISKYPDSYFEVSVVMAKREHFSGLEQTLRGSLDASLLKSIEVVSVYQGKPLKEAEKSVSVRLSFGREDSTISSDELLSLRNAVIGAVESSDYVFRE